MSVREKTDGYGLYLFLMFFVVITIKAIVYGIFSIRPNYIFDVAIFILFLVFGMALIALKMRDYL